MKSSCHSYLHAKCIDFAIALLCTTGHGLQYRGTTTMHVKTYREQCAPFALSILVIIRYTSNASLT